jgi:predicted naringenin-chalcone synthase
MDDARALGASRAAFGVPRITRIATALPGARHDQLGIAERMASLHGMDARGARRLRAYYQKTRIAARYSVLPRDWTRADGGAFFRPGEVPSTAARMEVFASEAPALAERAAARIFDGAGDSTGRGRAPRPADVDHLVVVSCTGFLAPGLDVLLLRRLGLRSEIGRTLVGFQGCHAGLSALRLARDIASAHPARSVLIVAVELSTLHFQYEPTRANLLANALFGDGAAAVLVDGAEVVRPPGTALEIASTETHLLPEGGEDMRWSVGDRGFTLALSERLPGILERHVRGLFAPEGAAWAVHPGGATILDAVGRGLSLDEGALADARATLRDAGNLSSATIFFVLERMWRALATGRAAVPRGEGATHGRIVALAFGPGLTLEIARLSTRTRTKDDDAWLPGTTSRYAATSGS